MNDSNHKGGTPPELPEDLNAALAGWTVPKANADFKSRQRHAFLAAAQAGPKLSEAAALEQLATWEAEPAREEFRAKLRTRFLAAAAEYDAVDSPLGALRPLAADAVPSRGALRGPRRPRPLLTKAFGTALAAAAAVLLYVGFGGGPLVQPTLTVSPDLGAGGWQTVNFVQGDQVVLDGREKLSGADKRIGAAVTLGNCRIETGGGNLAMVHYGEGVLLEFPPETELRFPPTSPGEHGLIEIEVLRGGLRVATTAAFKGRILVHTPHTTIALAGHSIGIDVMAEGTCLCALTGRAEIRPLKEAEGCSGNYEMGSQSMRFVRPCGTVVEYPEGEVHHSKELEHFAELGEKFLY